MGMCGGSNNAAKQAQANEDARNRQIADSTAQINAIFDNPARTGAYDQLASDTTKYYTDQLNRQKAINDRQLKFTLARGGQVGGSVQSDLGARAGRDYLNGVLEATRRGNAAGAALRSQDEQSRANLIAAAQGGLDATSAASQAAGALRTNLQSGQAGATANAFGDAFGDFANIYQRSQDAKALRDGYATGAGLYQPGFGAGGVPRGY
ncbi:hypothetical protein ACO2Q2_13345 [Dyella sp. KRB-257]|uniref:hypothetical protein n=1 Tax=Dyella sp. KRB-257 TaxID=3400915 RepID=UPI003C10EE88